MTRREDLAQKRPERGSTKPKKSQAVAPRFLDRKESGKHPLPCPTRSAHEKTDMVPQRRENLRSEGREEAERKGKGKPSREKDKRRKSTSNKKKRRKQGNEKEEKEG
jgi:hypothetical protein